MELLGQLKIEILELFKGSARTEIYETGKETSCEMGIFVGQEWVLFGYDYKGEIYIGACNHDFKYKERWLQGMGIPKHFPLNQKSSEVVQSRSSNLYESDTEGILFKWSTRSY
jgi:hypothetical protein